MKERLRLAINFIMQALRKQWKGVLAYSLFSVGALLFFLYLTLPWELLENRILYELSKVTSMDIKARESHYLFPSGIRLSGLLFSNPASDVGQSGGKDPSVKPIGKIEEISLQVRLTDLLWGTVRSTFTANAFGGQITGTFGDQGKKKDLDTEWKKIDLASVKNVANLQVGLAGNLQGKGHLVLGPEGPTGEIRLTIDHGKIKDLKLMGFTLPEITFEEVRGSGEIKNRALILKEVKLRGDDVKGSVKGEITLADNKAPAVLNLQFHIHLSEQARAPYQGMLSLVERNRDKEGYYNFSITGTTKEPRVNL